MNKSQYAEKHPHPIESTVTSYGKFIHFIFLENIQQSFETDLHILHLLLSISSSGNSKDSKITKLDMNCHKVKFTSNCPSYNYNIHGTLIDCCLLLRYPVLPHFIGLSEHSFFCRWLQSITWISV